MKRVEEGRCDERLGPYERGRPDEDTLANAGEAKSCQMSGKREAIVKADPKASLVEMLVDDDHVERIRRVNGDISHHVNADMFLPPV